MLQVSGWFAGYIFVLTGLLGLAMGSFLNCFAYRYANKESVLKGRSHCTACGHDLRFLDLIPVFNWLFLRGKCRYCGSKVSPRYVVTELLCAVIFLSVVLRFGISLETLQYLVLMSLLFAAALTDLYCGLIPDRLILIGIAAAVVFTCFAPGNLWWNLLDMLIGGFSVALPLLLIVLLFDRVMKRETMGGGDIKLIFLIGLNFHWSLNILMIIFACFLGLLLVLVRHLANRLQKQEAFSFGPALAAAAWLVVLCGQPLLDWYLGFFL